MSNERIERINAGIRRVMERNNDPENPILDDLKWAIAEVTTLEKQLAAQRAIVAADDEWQRVRSIPSEHLSKLHAASNAMATAREEANR